MPRRAALPALVLVGLLAACAPPGMDGPGLGAPPLPGGAFPGDAFPEDGLPAGALPGDGLPVEAAPPSPAAPLTYRPAAFGPAGACYWVETPQEVQALVAAGLCPPGARPVQAPLGWQQTYHGYYSDAAYYGVFVPVALRAGWPARRTAFGSRHAAAVRAAAARGTWTGSDGARYTGTVVAAAKGHGAGTTGTGTTGTGARTGTQVQPGTQPGTGAGTAPRTAPRSGTTTRRR